METDGDASDVETERDKQKGSYRIPKSLFLLYVNGCFVAGAPGLLVNER